MVEMDEPDSTPPLHKETIVSCSICLETVDEPTKRSTAHLTCGHQFHLDCIGSAFNAKGAMQCPNCRKLEKEGDWRFANGPPEPPRLGEEPQPPPLEGDDAWTAVPELEDEVQFPPPYSPAPVQWERGELAFYAESPGVVAGEAPWASSPSLHPPFMSPSSSSPFPPCPYAGFGPCPAHHHQTAHPAYEGYHAAEGHFAASVDAYAEAIMDAMYDGHSAGPSLSSLHVSSSPSSFPHHQHPYHGGSTNAVTVAGEGSSSMSRFLDQPFRSLGGERAGMEEEEEEEEERRWDREGPRGRSQGFEFPVPPMFAAAAPDAEGPFPRVCPYLASRSLPYHHNHSSLQQQHPAPYLHQQFHPRPGRPMHAPVFPAGPPDPNFSSSDIYSQPAQEEEGTFQPQGEGSRVEPPARAEFADNRPFSSDSGPPYEPGPAAASPTVRWATRPSSADHPPSSAGSDATFDGSSFARGEDGACELLILPDPDAPRGYPREAPASFVFPTPPSFANGPSYAEVMRLMTPPSPCSPFRNRSLTGYPAGPIARPPPTPPTAAPYSSNTAAGTAVATVSSPSSPRRSAPPPTPAEDPPPTPVSGDGEDGVVAASRPVTTPPVHLHHHYHHVPQPYSQPHLHFHAIGSQGQLSHRVRGPERSDLAPPAAGTAPVEWGTLEAMAAAAASSRGDGARLGSPLLTPLPFPPPGAHPFPPYMHPQRGDVPPPYLQNRHLESMQPQRQQLMHPLRPGSGSGADAGVAVERFGGSSSSSLGSLHQPGSGPRRNSGNHAGAQAQAQAGGNRNGCLPPTPPDSRASLPSEDDAAGRVRVPSAGQQARERVTHNQQQQSQRGQHQGGARSRSPLGRQGTPRHRQQQGQHQQPQYQLLQRLLHGIPVDAAAAAAAAADGGGPGDRPGNSNFQGGGGLPPLYSCPTFNVDGPPDAPFRCLLCAGDVAWRDPRFPPRVSLFPDFASLRQHTLSRHSCSPQSGAPSL